MLSGDNPFRVEVLLALYILTATRSVYGVTYARSLFHR